MVVQLQNRLWREFPAGPAVRTRAFTAMGLGSLVGELRSCKLRDVAKKFKKLKKEGFLE